MIVELFRYLSTLAGRLAHKSGTHFNPSNDSICTIYDGVLTTHQLEEWVVLKRADWQALSGKRETGLQAGSI